MPCTFLLLEILPLVPLPKGMPVEEQDTFFQNENTFVRAVMYSQIRVNEFSQIAFLHNA